MTRKIAPCVTEAGYGTHRRRGEPTCAECRAAHNQYVRAFKRRRKSATTTVTSDLFVRMYLECSPALQIEIEDRYGDERMRALVTEHDQSAA